MRRLTELEFDNSYARLPQEFYSKLLPTPLPDPYLVSFNPAAAALIDLDAAEAARPEFIDYFSGNRRLPGSEPLAMLYAGHQFGVYVPQLGDGRAILLGEVSNHRGERWDLHLKGAGKTPYSRGFDGRAVLRSSIREYLCSEAMHNLGIPTTRALCIIGSDEKVYRETTETAAVVTRMSPSHVRFGSFEVFFYRDQHDRLRTLADYVIGQHFPHLTGRPDRYAGLLSEVAVSTARLIAMWQAVGFAHGVMNTDNMSILGLTIDYGPFGFLDEYDPMFICNHSDHCGRYAFYQQPGIGLWNLTCLAQTFLPLISEAEATAALSQYEPAFNEKYGELMRAKLGLRTAQADDLLLIADLLKLMHDNGSDYTNLFRALADIKVDDDDSLASSRKHFGGAAGFDAWAQRYRARLRAEQSDDRERAMRMNRVNPRYVLRNYLAHKAITLAVEKRDYSEIDRLMALLSDPFTDRPEMESYTQPPPNWARALIISCSS